MPGITLVQTQTNSASATSLSFASNTTAGNCLVVCVMSSGNSSNVPSVSGVTIGGSASNFAALKSNTFTFTFATGAFIWACPNCPGGQTLISVSGTNLGGQELGIVAYEVSGLANSIAGLLDQFSVNGATGSSWTSNASGTISHSPEFIVGCAATLTTITGPSAPWTNSLGTGNTVAGQQISSSTGTFTYSGTQTGSTAAYAAVVVTLQSPITTSPSTTPIAWNLGTNPISIGSPIGYFIPQNPANRPNTFVKGITASVAVSSTVNASVTKSGLTGNSTASFPVGGIAVITTFYPPAPYPLTAPYPLNLSIGSFKIQPQQVASGTTPPTVVLGITANVNVSTNIGTPAITNPSVYNWQFSFANNIPYPLNIINNNVKPNIQGQPQVWVKQPATANESATAILGTVTIGASITAHENVTANIGNIFIMAVVQPSFTFTNFPHPLRFISRLVPQYSSGNQWLPTNIHGQTAQVNVATSVGTIQVGRHIPGFTSLIFAATVPGTPVIIQSRTTSTVSARTNIGLAKNTLTGITSQVTSSAPTGTIKVTRSGSVSTVNVTPEIGRISAGNTFHGNVSSVTSVAFFGSINIKIGKTANVNATLTQNHSIIIPGRVATASQSSPFGIVKISQSITARVSISSSPGLTISLRTGPAKVTSGTVSRPVVSPHGNNTQVISSSIPGVRTNIGETSSVSSAAPIGIIRIFKTGTTSLVTSRAPNEGTVVHGITASSTASANIGTIRVAYSITPRVISQAYYGIASEWDIDVNLITRFIEC